MRNSNRLYRFYNELRDVQMEYFQNWRFEQFALKFLSWAYNTKKSDPFFWEEKKFLENVHEYIENQKVA